MDAKTQAMKPNKNSLRWCINFIKTIVILTSLPYTSTLSLPNGDPAPGRSPGPPKNSIDTTELDHDYDTTTEYTATQWTEVSTSVGTVSACDVSRVTSDEVVTLTAVDSDVNLTLTHPVFETDELVRGVTYEGFSLLYQITSSDHDADVDNIIKKIVGDPTAYKKQIGKFSRRTTKAMTKDTAPNILRRNGVNYEWPANLTQEIITERRKLIRVEMILDRNDTSVMDAFEQDQDDVNVITEQYDALNRTKRTRREYYFNDEDAYVKPREKRLAIDLMSHFIYQARYKLPFAQIMRKKYRNETLYKIGYCFSMLKNLKLDQRMVFSSLRTYLYDTVDLGVPIKMYSRIQQLQVDIKDLLAYIWALNEQRKLEQKTLQDSRMHIESSDALLRDYVLSTAVDGFIRGNFTPTDFAERPCREQEPHFIPKPHSKFKKRYWQPGTSKTKHFDSEVRYDYDYRTGNGESGFSDYFFRPRKRAVLSSDSFSRVRKSLKFRRDFLPARIVSGPLGDRRRVVLRWSVSDSMHVESEEASVVFRLRYRKTTSATIYQVFFTKSLRIDCAIKVRATRVGRVHSGHLPRARGCRLLLPAPAPPHALLLELHKLNVPCSTGFIRFAPNTPTLCGKLEQIPATNRRFIYHANSKGYAVELHGRPMFAATYKVVDHCHEMVLTDRQGSFGIGPTDRLQCSYKIHLPYGSLVALRLQMGTGPIINKEVTSKVYEDSHQLLCKGMSLTLEDGDSKWRHCSQQGDPLRSVQIVSEGNLVRLNISVLVKRSVAPMWLKVWWMDKSLPAVVGQCAYGWVLSGDVCVSSYRQAKKGWRQAEAECVREGGHLASIANEEQQRVLELLLSNTPGAGVDDVYWVGATDALHEGEFRWSNGMPFTFTNWYPGWRRHTSQPNDDGMSGQDCVEVRRDFPPRPAPLPARPAPRSFMWNDRGCGEHNYFVCERPVDEYPATNIHNCNETIALSRSHPSAVVHSPGYPSAYPDDVTCITELRAPPHHTIHIHFEELTTEYEFHCAYDYLEIEETGALNISAGAPHDIEWFPHEYRADHDIDNEVWDDTELLPSSDDVSTGWSRNSTAHVRRVCGDWAGKLKLATYRSSTSALRMRFSSDHLIHKQGYRATVTLPHIESCTDSKQVLHEGYCYLFTGHPRASWATAKQICEGLNMQLSSVHSPEEQRFITSSIRSCSDYSAGSTYWLGSRLEGQKVSWVDGTGVSYQGWPPYNDTEVGADNGSCLGVLWKTSPVPSQPSGLYWAAHKCSLTGGYVCKRRLASEHIVTNQTVEGSEGTLTSPNYPALYDNDLDYWVHVVGPTDTRLVFVFDQLDLEFQQDCLYDYIELRDGATSKSSRYCGSLTSTRWAASSNRAVLHFHSDYNSQSLGFLLNWKAVDMSGCPVQSFTSKEGVIRSPNYPDFLLPNLDCTFDILAPAGKRIFLNITYFDFGHGIYEKGVPSNTTEAASKDSILEVQVDLLSPAIQPFRNPSILTNGLFLSETEVLRVTLKTGVNATGRGFLAHYKSVNFLNATHVLDLRDVRSGRLTALNWPAAAPRRMIIRSLVVAPHHHTLSAAFAGTRLVLPEAGVEWPCGEGRGWVEVKDSYTDNNGTQWTLCAVYRDKRKVDASPPLIINSYLNSLIVTQCAEELGVDMDVSLSVVQDPDYHNKIMILPEDTNLESCYPNPCQYGGRCTGDESRNYCQCASYYTGVFCLLTACDRSPCANGNCTLSTIRLGAEGFECGCAAGFEGRRCNKRIRPCQSRPCNNRGACLEKDGGFMCQCTPSWKGKQCEMPNPSPNIIGLGTRMMNEPFWLGLLAVFLVLGMVGLIWCAKRHFPEKIEKLLAEEADRNARRTPSPRKKRNNSTPTKKNAAEKTQILQQLISPASANDHSRKITMGELIQMSEKRTLSTVESAPAFMEYGLDNRETSFASEGSSPSTSPSMRHISDPKLEKKVTFARLLNKVSAEMSSSSEVDMMNTIAIPMAVMSNRGLKVKASSTPPSPGVEVKSPHSTSSNQGSDSMSSLDLTLAHAALSRKYCRQPKISSADSILAMFRNFSSSSAAMASRASSGGVSASSTPSASSPQDDTVDGDDASIASSLVPSLAPDSPISRQYNTIEIQVLDPLSAHKSSSSGNLLHPPSILLEVPSSINKCLSPIREMPTPLPTPMPTPMPTPLPSPRMHRARMDDEIMSYPSPSEDEMDEIKMERPSTSALRLRLRQPAMSPETPTPSTHVASSPSPSFTHSQDSEREMSSPSPRPTALSVPAISIERPSPGSPPPKRTPPHVEFQPPPLITITYNPSEESDEPLSPRPPPNAANMCYLSPFSMSARGERAPSESNLSSSGYSSMASPGPSRCGSSNPLCPSEMDDPGSGGGPSCFARRRPLMKTNSGPAASNEESKERRRGRSDSETLSDDPLLESNDEGIGTDERVDDVPSSAKEMETLVVLKETLDLPQATLCPPVGVTKCSIVRCISVERGLDEKVSLKPPIIECCKPLSPVSSRSESPLSDKTGLGRFSPLFYGRQLPFTDSDGLYDFPSSECVKGSSKAMLAQRKAGKKRDRKTTRTVSHEVTGTAKSTLPHLPHSMHNLLEVPRDSASATRARKLGRRRSRSQAPAVVVSSSSEDSVSNASVASVASAREFRVATDLDMQDTSSKISSSLDLTEDSRRPGKVNKLRSISNQIRFLRRIERTLKMKESYPPPSDDEGDESSSVTSPLLQGRGDRAPSHAISAPLLSAPRPKIARQRRYDTSLLGEERRMFNTAGNDNSD